MDSMLRLMGRELGLERRDALALASVVVDLRITQVVNGVMGVHAVLPHGVPRLGKNLGVAYEFKLPDLGEGLTEGEIARWLVSEGQEIAEDDPLVEVADRQDDGRDPLAGCRQGCADPRLRGRRRSGRHRPGRDRRRRGRAAAGGRAGGAEPAPAAHRAAAASPRPGCERRRWIRRMAQELGVDLESVEGPGPQGRITEDDVRRAGARRRLVGEGRREPRAAFAASSPSTWRRAHREVPPVTWVEECDFGAVELKRLVPTVLKAVAERPAGVPRAERAARGRRDRLPRPLRPRRRRADRAGPRRPGRPRLRGQEPSTSSRKRSARLAEAARGGTLKPEELRDSTFTVTSAGKLGGLLTTPIVNHPEVAILSVGRVAERPVVRDGKIEARPTGTIAITFDHRVVDGARAAEFGLAVIDRLA